ncbi:MAG: hypothetical protein M3Q22_03180 [Actinomycetota bacterium]|nr:hypothetical protein [Actinomycetota bacterium]
MSTSSAVPDSAQGPAASTGDAPITLAEPRARVLGLMDTLGLWGNLGISLLLPVAATFVVLEAGTP